MAFLLKVDNLGVDESVAMDAPEADVRVRLHVGRLEWNGQAG